MNKKFALIGAGALAAAGIFFISRNEPAPPAQQTQGSIAVRNIPASGSVCVNPIQNNSKSKMAMDGADDLLVLELKKVGLTARKTADGGACDASVFTEVVEVGGRGRKSAEVDFRLVVANEVAPRFSSVAKGKSGEALPPMETAGNSFTGAKPKFQVATKSDRTELDREALASAFAEQARQIEAAQRAAFPAKTN